MAKKASRRLRVSLTLGLFLPLAFAAVATAAASPARREYTFLEAVKESLVGDVYAEPERWRSLSYGTLFTEGWDEPWVSPPNGGGGAPRQGWLRAADGVFYRLGIGVFGYQHDLGGNGPGYSGTFSLFTPFVARFEILTDTPIVSTRGGSDNEFHKNFGDFQITPRVILSETENVTQSFNLTFRTPSGSTDNGNGVAAVTPSYEIWANWWRGLVLRGGLGMYAPYGHKSIREVNARTEFRGNFSFGYYFTPHDLTPVGDLVFYLATNLSQATDDRGPATTTLKLAPGFRTHLGANWYLLGAVDVPVTNPEPFDAEVLAGLMKVF